MYRFSLLLLLSLFSFNSFSQETITAPAIWLKVNKDSIKAEVWNDISGNDNDAILPKQSNDSLFSINFNPARKFNSLTEFGSIAYNPDGVSNITILAVYKPSDTTEIGILASKNTLKREFSFSNKNVLGPDSITHHFSEGSTFPELTSITQVWEDSKEVSENGSLMFLGAKNAEGQIPFKGLISEVLFFDEALSFVDRLKWETYLAIKYGLTLQEKNYLSSSEMVLWNAEDLTDYSNRITGIGKDDFLN